MLSLWRGRGIDGRRRRAAASAWAALTVAACGAGAGARGATSTPGRVGEGAILSVGADEWLSTARPEFHAAAGLAARLKAAAHPTVEVRLATTGGPCPRGVRCGTPPPPATGPFLRVRVAALGDSAVVRVELASRAGVGPTREFQATMVLDDALAVRQGFEQLAARVLRELDLARPPATPQPVWYERGWVWATVGVVLTGAGVAAVLLGSRDDEEVPPDVVITPP